MTAKKKEDSLTIEDKLKAALVPEAEQPYPIPRNWVWTKMGAITRIVGGGTPRSHDPALYEDGAIPWIRPVDLSGYDDMYISQGSRNITEEGLRNSSARLIPKNSLLFSSRAPIGYVAISANEVTTSQGFKSFLPTSALVPQYGYWYLKSAKPLAESLASGTTFQEISGAKATLIPIPLPPLSEQQRIAEKLESLLGKIKEAKALLDEIPEILQNFRQSVLASACSGRLTEDWRAENPDINAAKKISKVNESGSVLNDTQLFQIPNNWAWKKVGDICTVITGKTPPTADPKYTESDDLPFITPAAFNMGDRLSYSERYVSNAAVKVAPLIPAKSVLLTSIGATLGKVAFLEVPAVVNQQINALIPRDIEAVYIFRWTCSQSFQETMWAKSSATTLPIINKSRCEQLPIPIPPLPEQQEIVRRVESLFSKADDLEAQYKEAMELIETLPEIILSKAFRGELVPQNPNDEPAFGLLERITFEKEKHETEKVEGTKRKKHKQSV